MKRAKILAVFLVTWKTFSAEMSGARLGHTSRVNGAIKIDPVCELVTNRHQEEFYDWFKAAARATVLKADSNTFDVKIWELEEPEKFKERK